MKTVYLDIHYRQEFGFLLDTPPIIPLGSQFKLDIQRIVEEDGKHYVESYSRYYESISETLERYTTSVRHLGSNSFWDELGFHYAVPCVEISKEQVTELSNWYAEGIYRVDGEE